MIDHLLTALQKRQKAYDVVSGKFGFLSKMPSVNGDQLRDSAERLVKTVAEDLNTSFPEEIVHFQEYMKMNLNLICGKVKREKIKDLYCIAPNHC